MITRLLTFSKLRDEATSLAKKVIKPLLRLLDDNGPVAVCTPLIFMKTTFSYMNLTYKNT
jgi:hypothetical protein